MYAKDQWILSRAIALYYYNVSPIQWASEFQTKLAGSGPRRAWSAGYFENQVKRYARGFQSHFGELDFRRQQAQIEMILECYGAEAERDWHTCSSGRA